jgi:hypothetical protein
VVVERMPHESLAAWMTARVHGQVVLLYLPCLIAVLCRPNVAPVGDGFMVTIAWLHANMRRIIARRAAVVPGVITGDMD